MRRALLFIFFSLICHLANAQEAVTLTVDSEIGIIKTGETCAEPRGEGLYFNIQAAIDCAQPGDELSIRRGTYFESIFVDKNLTLNGVGSVTAILDGSVTGRVITITNNAEVLIGGVTIQNGRADQGGGVYIESGKVTLSDTTIIQNTATQQGGAIYIESGDVVFRYATVNQNAVLSDKAGNISGGAMYVKSGTVTLSASTFSRNKLGLFGCGTALGGAIFNLAGVVNLSGTIVANSEIMITGCEDGASQSAGIGAYSAVDTLTISTWSMVRDQITINASQPIAAEAPSDGQQPSVNSDTQVLIGWMQTFLQAAETEQLSPPVTSRLYAYAGITLYESLIPGLPDHVSLSGQLTAMPPMPQPETGLAYDWLTVANHALYTVLMGLLPDATETTPLRFIAQRDMVDRERREIVTPEVFQRSQVYGEQLAQMILAWAAADNYAVVQQLTYNLPADNPSYWTPLENQQPIEPYWGTLRPFVLSKADSCQSPQPIPFSENPASEFYAQADEVRETVQNLTRDQRATAAFWAETPGHWVSIVNQVIQQQNLSLGQALDAHTLTGIALADAFIGCWDGKYRYQLLRPVSYIQTYIDPNWQTAVNTPAFPEYPAGYAAASSAAAWVLTELIGAVPLSDDSRFPPRRYESFTEAADEAAISQLYGGIHYRMSIETGQIDGRCIGQQVIGHLNLYRKI